MTRAGALHGTMRPAAGDLTRPGPARDRALGHWFGIQVLNALWLWLGFGERRLGAATVEAFERLQALQARRDEIAARPRERRVELRPTGQTYRQAWAHSDTDARRALIAANLAAIVLRLRNRTYRRIHDEETRDRDRDGIPDAFDLTP